MLQIALFCYFLSKICVCAIFLRFPISVFFYKISTLLWIFYSILFILHESWNECWLKYVWCMYQIKGNGQQIAFQHFNNCSNFQLRVATAVMIFEDRNKSAVISTAGCFSWGWGWGVGGGLIWSCSSPGIFGCSFMYETQGKYRSLSNSSFLPPFLGSRNLKITI